MEAEMSPTQRSKKFMEKQGYLCAITERWNPHVNIRQDLFGFIDMIAIKGDDVLAIQTTSGSNVSARIKKIVSLHTAGVWLESVHRRIVVHGWSKQGPRGKRKVWTCRQQPVFPSQFTPLPICGNKKYSPSNP